MPGGWLSCPQHPMHSWLALRLLPAGLQLGFSGLLLLQRPMRSWLLVASWPVCRQLLLLLFGRQRLQHQQQARF